MGNRRAFEGQLRDAANTAFSVAMLDLDGLKRINDTRGHAAGDALLQVLAAPLRANAPRTLQVFRPGGDELALLMMHNRSGPVPLVDRTIHAVVDMSVAAAQAAGFPEAGCSFGVVHWPADGRASVDVVALADTRLYTEKQARRAHSSAAERPPSNMMGFGNAVLDVAAREVRGPLGQAKLSPREAELLRVLTRRSQQVVSRADITAMSGLCGSETGGALDVHISNLRRKIAGVTEHAGIRSIRGKGFSLHWYKERIDS
ncbi:diguanylate cyclase domain-containing protein [Deinococcus arenae]|nr:diguanylate cyclase [Deinococcus arenae]